MSHAEDIVDESQPVIDSTGPWLFEQPVAKYNSAYREFEKLLGFLISISDSDLSFAITSFYHFSNRENWGRLLSPTTNSFNFEVAQAVLETVPNAATRCCANVADYAKYDLREFSEAFATSVLSDKE